MSWTTRKARPGKARQEGKARQGKKDVCSEEFAFETRRQKKKNS
jgi:hypothetical protein